MPRRSIIVRFYQRAKRRWHQRMVSRLGMDKLESWASRDQMLMDQWWAAYERSNIEEMERLNELINKNWREYREAS